LHNFGRLAKAIIDIDEVVNHAVPEILLRGMEKSRFNDNPTIQEESQSRLDNCQDQAIG